MCYITKVVVLNFMLCYNKLNKNGEIIMKKKTREKMVYAISIFMLIAFILGLIPALM